MFRSAAACAPLRLESQTRLCFAIFGVLSDQARVEETTRGGGGVKTTSQFEILLSKYTDLLLSEHSSMKWSGCAISFFQ